MWLNNNSHVDPATPRQETKENYRPGLYTIDWGLLGPYYLMCIGEHFIDVQIKERQDDRCGRVLWLKHHAE